MRGNQAPHTQQMQAQGQLFTTLPDLLRISETIPVIEAADSSVIDNMLNHLPPVLLLQGQKADSTASADPNPETAKAALEALSLDEKKEMLTKVLRSPQFTQSLASLTGALRDGGLPTISEALKIPVENGGFTKRGELPLGGGDAVEAFLNGVKASVRPRKRPEEGKMDTD